MRATPSAMFLIAALYLVWGCEAGGLKEQLAGAKPGEEITIEAGTYEGPFRVAAGAIVKAEGEVVITVSQAANLPALIVDTLGAVTTSLTGLRIESDGRAGIAVQGTGEFFATDTVIYCQRGVGLAAEGVTGVTLRNVQINGSVTQAMIPQLTYPVRDTSAPTIGMALSRVVRAELRQVQIKGFAGFGAVFAGSQVFWQTGTISDSVGVGVILEGGKLETSEPLTITNLWAGTGGVGMIPYGLMLGGSAQTDASNLTISNVEGPGVVQTGGRGIYRALKVENNGDVGVWLQSASGTMELASLKVIGSSNISGNVGGGIFVVNSGGIEISDSTIGGTTEKEMASNLGQEQMADGIHVADLTNALTIKNVTLTNNKRVGLLLSGNTPEEQVRVTGVSIVGSGQYGMLTVNGFKKEADWDVKRDAQLQQADNAFSGGFGGAAALGTIPTASLITQKGLLTLVQTGSSVSPAGLGN